MGLAPAQQGARAHEVSAREKQGVAPARRHARARAMGGKRWQAVPARACEILDVETANLKQNLTASWIRNVILACNCNSGQKALNGSSAALQAAPRRHGRPGPGPGGAAAQPNVGTCENRQTFATLLQKLLHTSETVRGHRNMGAWRFCGVKGGRGTRGAKRDVLSQVEWLCIGPTPPSPHPTRPPGALSHRRAHSPQAPPIFL